MSRPILQMDISSHRDVIAVRKRTRDIAAALGMGPQDQAKVATAVSEIANNALKHASGGRAKFFLDRSEVDPTLVVIVSDSGRGIGDLNDILQGRGASSDGLGVGIIGAQRLLDRCDIDTAPGRGTIVTMSKRLAAGTTVDKAALAELERQLAEPHSTMSSEEDLAQHRELLQTLAELRARQDELVALTRELEDTNRGVVALYAEIEEKAEALRHADEMKSRFLSNTSHELRTPLSSIRALSQLLLDRVDGELTEAQEKQVRFIEKAANDLSELVNDLLDLAKIEAGKVDITPSEFSVADLFSMLRGMLRPLAGTQQVELVFDEAAYSGTVLSDEGKVSQILRNLISNALKFTEHGEVRVASRLDGDTVHFSVSDTGIGIASSNLQLIFEEFSQVENPLQKRIKGTGLGLPLCRRLAELLGGSVSVSSEYGRGSCFTLSIPRHWTPGLSSAVSPGAGLAANPDSVSRNR